MTARRVFAFVILALIMAWCGRDGARLHAQTRPRPGQIQNWTQIAPGACTGTCLYLDQLAIDPALIELWDQISQLRWPNACACGVLTEGYDHFRVAIGDDRAPILIPCPRAEDDPLGPGCAGQFWFRFVHRQ